MGDTMVGVTPPGLQLATSSTTVVLTWAAAVTGAPLAPAPPPQPRQLSTDAGRSPTDTPPPGSQPAAVCMPARNAVAGASEARK
jgi:hypothetical protein